MPCASASPARWRKPTGPCARWIPTAPCSPAPWKSATGPSICSPSAAMPEPSAASTSPAPKPRSPPPRPTASASIKRASNSSTRSPCSPARRHRLPCPNAIGFAETAGGSRLAHLRVAAPAPRHPRRRAQRGRRERRHRRGHRRVLSLVFDRRLQRIRCHQHERSFQRFLARSGRSVPGRSCPITSQKFLRAQRRPPSPPTMRPARITARRCSNPSARSKTRSRGRHSRTPPGRAGPGTASRPQNLRSIHQAFQIRTRQLPRRRGRRAHPSRCRTRANAIRAERLAVSVSLIKAIGGEW
jgi:hypothetical protein